MAEKLQKPPPVSRDSALRVVGICAALIVGFVVIAWIGVRDKSATYDEPLDSIEGWIVTRYSDYRIAPTDPPLAYAWSALLQPRDALRADFNSTVWREAAHASVNEHDFSSNTLYRTPGNDADRFLNRSRAMMLVLGAAGAAVVAAWGYRLGGAGLRGGGVRLVLFRSKFDRPFATGEERRERFSLCRVHHGDGLGHRTASDDRAHPGAELFLRFNRLREIQRAGLWADRCAGADRTCDLAAAVGGARPNSQPLAG